MSKTIVLGLDGACWPLIEPWIEAGNLPNLAALRQEAAWGPLISQLPPVTSPNWRCYATGRNPARLGVFWWEIVDRVQKTIRHPSARDYHTQPFWHDLGLAGHQVAVLNFPTGYPPLPIPNGRFTAGGPGARDSGFAFPAAWEAELRRHFGYRVHPTAVLQSAYQVERQYPEILSIIQSRFDVAFDLLDQEIDFLHITIFYINVLQHFWYRGEPTRAGWRVIDQNLGRLWEIATAKNYNLLLMSDHGCAPVDTVFYVNTWLRQEGYLTANLPATPSRLSRWGIHRSRLISLARRSGLAPLLRRLVPPQWHQALPAAGGTYDKEAKGQRIDWEHSQAVASGQGPIYLLLAPDHPQYEALRAEIAAKLMELRNPTTGQPVVTRVLQREEIYQGPFFEQAPDLIFEQGPGIHTSGGVGYPHVFAPPEKWAADNVVEGLFLASGPDFGPPGPRQQVQIVDLAPTILHLMGLPVPEDVDGQVRTDLFQPASDAARRPIHTRPADAETEKEISPEEEAELARRLAALGYLD